MQWDRSWTTSAGSGPALVTNISNFLSIPPMSTFWEVLPGSLQTSIEADDHKSRIVVKHIETNEYFNLIQFSYEYQEFLVFHNCGETVINADYGNPGNNYYDLQWNAPASVMQLTYPADSEFLLAVGYSIVGTSQFIFIASKFDKGDNDISSQGMFGFIDSYSDIICKVTGGLPTNNFTFRPITLQHHFWESGYQNFTMKLIQNAEFDLLTTFQVHDLSDLVGSYYDRYLFPLIYFEQGSEDYSGRIAGQIHDCWYAELDQTYANAHLMYADISGASDRSLRVFRDGENADSYVAIRLD